MKVDLETPHILSFFRGETEESPVEEMKYIVEKKPVHSFLDDITEILSLAARKAATRNIKTYDSYTITEKFAAYLALLHTGIDKGDDEYIHMSLLRLRDIYQIADSIRSL